MDVALQVLMHDTSALTNTAKLKNGVNPCVYCFGSFPLI